MLISAQKRVSRSDIGNLCRPGLQLGQAELVTDTSRVENKPGESLGAGMYMELPSYYAAVRVLTGNAGKRMGCDGMWGHGNPEVNSSSASHPPTA